jgi:hypothetical protein
VTTNNTNILANIRELLLLFDDVTDLVDTRVRVDGFAESDGTQPAIMLELTSGDQTNFLGGGAAIMGDLLVTARATNEGLRTDIADAVHGVLNGYKGSAGLGRLCECQRTGTVAGKLYDQDGDETDFYEQRDTYRILYSVT